MTKPQLGQAKRISLRMAYAEIMASSDVHVWCWDGRDHNARRRAIYPGYKAKREPMSEDHFSQIQLFRELLTHSRAWQVDCAGWEADDVVATLARKYAAGGAKVVCHSNDLDYLQLEANPNITIDGIGKRPCDPRWIPLYKALQGDSSDNIPGVRGFGPKAWDTLSLADREALERWIAGKPADICRVPLAPAVRRQLEDPEILKEIQSYLLITHLFSVPADELEKGTVASVPNLEGANAIFTRYFL